MKIYDLIKKYEGCRLKAYPDPATNSVPYTIGWGTTIYPNGEKVKIGDGCTQKEADFYLDWYCKTQIKLPKGDFTDEQKAALYSISYNIGGSFELSKCYRYIEEKKWEQAFAEWNWCRANGQVLKGLVRRRKEERFFFFKNILDVDFFEKKYYSKYIALG